MIFYIKLSYDKNSLVFLYIDLYIYLYDHYWWVVLVLGIGNNKLVFKEYDLPRGNRSSNKRGRSRWLKDDILNFKLIGDCESPPQ